MMKHSLVKLLLLLFSFTLLIGACVPVRPPASPHKAKKRYERHVRALDQLVKLYPHLQESSIQSIRDTIYIPYKESIVEIQLAEDTSRIDSLLNEYDAIKAELDTLGRKKIIDGSELEMAKAYTTLLLQRLKTIKGEFVKAHKDTTFTITDTLQVQVNDQMFKLLNTTVVEIINGNIKVRSVQEGGELKVEYTYQKNEYKVTINELQRWLKKTWRWIMALAIIGGVIYLVLKFGIKFIKPF